MVVTYIDRIELNYLNLPLIWWSHNRLINNFWKFPCKIGLTQQNGYVIHWSYWAQLPHFTSWFVVWQQNDWPFLEFPCKIGFKKPNDYVIYWSYWAQLPQCTSLDLWFDSKVVQTMLWIRVLNKKSEIWWYNVKDAVVETRR